MISDKELKKILLEKGLPIDDINDILNVAVRKEALEQFDIRKRILETGIRIYGERAKNDLAIADIVEGYRAELAGMTDPSQYVDNYIKMVKKKGWSTFVSLPLLIKQQPKRIPLLVDTFKRDKIVVVVHPNYNQVKNTRAIQEQNVFGNYTDYQQNLKQYLLKNKDNTFFIFFVGVDMLNDFLAWYKPTFVPFIIVPTKPTSADIKKTPLLTDPYYLSVFLKRLVAKTKDKKVHIMGENLWVIRPVVINMQEILPLLGNKNKGVKDKLLKLIDKTPFPDMEDVLKLLSTASDLEEIKPRVKMRLACKDGCVSGAEGVFKKFRIKTERVKNCCFPLKETPDKIIRI